MYVREHVGEEFPGRITGVAAFGVFVTLDELYVEGMVHVSELGAEYFQYIEAGHELRGERTGQRFRLTDPIDVQVSRVDLEARRIVFRLVQRTDFRSLNRERERESKAQLRADASDGTTTGRTSVARKVPRKSSGKTAAVETARKSPTRAVRTEATRVTGKRRRRS
jgi:ribonuclease R